MTGVQTCALPISIKVFGLTVACCGLNENKARKAGLEFNSVCGTWYDRPDYHPDAKTLFGKLIYEKNSNRVLGLQMVGLGEVTRYIDAFSAIASKKGALDDLVNFEHCYTPPHSGPINPLNNLGAMALNQELFSIECINPSNFNIEDYEVLDLREESEVNTNSINTELKNYPITEYLNHLNEFDNNKKIVTICQKGPRAYEAAVSLKQNGCNNVAYLGGGMQLWKQIFEESDE